jgi:hypothetical protein
MRWLLLAKFAINNMLNKSLKITPFFANYEYHFQFGFEFIIFRNRSAAKNAKEFALQMKIAHEYLKSKIYIAQARHKNTLIGNGSLPINFI